MLSNKLIVHVSSVTDYVRDHKLQLHEAFLLGRIGVHRLLDSEGNSFVLKTDKLGIAQLRLLELAQEVDFHDGLRLPRIHTIGSISKNPDSVEAKWIIIEDIKGSKEAELVDTDAQFCIDKNWDMAQGYQKLLALYQSRYPDRVDIAQVETWLFDRLGKWSQQIITKGWLKPAEIEAIKEEWRQLFAQNGTDLIATVHGNIHGDHIIFPTREMGVVVDPEVMFRPGRGEYYDWLRSLDWMILKAREPKKMLDLVLANIRLRLPHIAEAELRAFLAVRAIGCLGADILSNMDTPPQGAESERVECFLHLIRGEYDLA